MTNDENTATLSTVVDRQKQSDKRIDRIEQILQQSGEERLKFAQEDQERQRRFDERLAQWAQENKEQHRLSNERLTYIEQIMAKLSEKQSEHDEMMERLAEKHFKQDSKNEEFESKLARAAQLLMQSALNHAQANKRFDRIEAELEPFSS